MSSKGRVVTSCSECYRRKQKCNRARPCNVCTSRGVEGKCRYGELPPSRDEAVHPAKRLRLSPEIETCPPLPPSDFIDQFGYSRATQSDQLKSLTKCGLSVYDGQRPNVDGFSTSGSKAYLSLVTQLPAEPVISMLIGIHFSEENWSFSVLDEHHFRQQYKRYRNLLPETNVCSPADISLTPALLFVVLAVALQFTSVESSTAHELGIQTQADCDRLSSVYMQTGQAIVDLLKIPRPTTTSIEYHLTKTSWLKNRGQGRESWQVLGIAVRQAQEMDLHQIREDVMEETSPDVEQTLLRLWQIEHQKRLWARLFIMDSHMALGLGRPRGINREDCSTSAPLDCDFPSNPSRTVPRSTRHPYEPPNAFSHMTFWIALSHKTCDVLSMRVSKSHLKDPTQIRTLHEAITSLLHEQPPSLRPIFPDTSWDQQMPHLPALRLRIAGAAQMIILALHRPYISTHPTSLYAALEAVFEILQIQQQLFELVPQAHRKLYGYSFYTVDAGIFLAAIVTKHFSSDMTVCNKALQYLRQGTARLAAMKERSPVARAGEPILRQCCQIVESSMRTPFSTASFGDFNDEELSKEVQSFLQDMSSNVPDEPARQFLATLAEPFTPESLPSSSAYPPSDIFGQSGNELLSYVNPEGSIW